MKKLIYIAISILGIGALLSGCAGNSGKRDLSWVNGIWYCPSLYGVSVFSKDSIRISKDDTECLLKILGPKSLRLGESLPYTVNGEYVFVDNKPAYYLSDSTKTLYKCHVQSLCKLAPLNKNSSDNWMKGYWLDKSEEKILKISDKVEVSVESYSFFYDIIDLPKISFIDAYATIDGNYMDIPSCTPRYWFNASEEKIEGIYTYEMCRFDEEAFKAEQESIAAMDKSWMYGIWVGRDIEGYDAYYEITPTKIVYINPFSGDYEEEYQIKGTYLLPKGIGNDAEALQMDEPHIKISRSEKSDFGWTLLSYDEPMRRSNLSHNSIGFHSLEKSHPYGFGLLSEDNTKIYIFFKRGHYELIGDDTVCDAAEFSVKDGMMYCERIFDYEVSGDKIWLGWKNFDTFEKDNEDSYFEPKNSSEGVYWVYNGVVYHPRTFPDDYCIQIYEKYFHRASDFIIADEVDPNTNDAAIQGRIQRETIQKMRELNSTSDPRERQRINNEIDQLHRQSNESTMENLRRGR